MTNSASSISMVVFNSEKCFQVIDELVLVLAATVDKVINQRKQQDLLDLAHLRWHHGINFCQCFILKYAHLQLRKVSSSWILDNIKC